MLMSYGVYMSQLVPFAKASRQINDLNNRNKSKLCSTSEAMLPYHQLRKTFSKF